MTEEQIIAYVDGELGPIEALRFERAMKRDSALAADVERHRVVRETITRHFAGVVDEPPPAELIALLDRDDKVVAFPRPRAGKRWFEGGGRYAALAATLVAGLMLGWLLPIGGDGPIGGTDGSLVAQGDLARALGETLTSRPQHGPNRIGVSFRTASGRYCRTFTTPAAAGIGCHGEPGWTIERFVAGPAADESQAYRQAASPVSEIMTAAQEMMVGAPLDADQEREAREGGWSAGPQP